jgi:hypothetical protein
MLQRGEIIVGFWLESLKENEYLEDLSFTGRVMLKHLKEVVWDGVCQIHLLPHRDKWWPVV